ncbi:MAG: sugar MFS transporter [Candidatus Nanopelagicales bacterium]
MSGQTAAVPRLVRDRTTWIVYGQIAVFGYFLYAFNPTVALVRDENGYSRSIASLIGALFALGAISGGLTANRLVRRFGRGPLLRTGSALIVTGLVIYTVGGGLPVLLLGGFVASLGGTFVMVGGNAFLTDHHGPASPRALTEAHGLATLAGLVGPLAIGALVAVGLGWRAGLLASCALLVVVEVVRGRGLQEYDGPHGHPDDEPGHAPHGPLPRRFWPALVIFACAVAVVFSLTLGGCDLLRDRAGLGVAAAAAALVTIVGGMAVGRLAGGPVVSRYGAERVLLGTIALTFVGFVIAWLSGSPVPMLLGLVVTGLGLGLQSPLAIGRAVSAAGGQVDRGAGLTSVAAGLASGIAPFVLASLADAVGVRTAFLLVPAILVTAVVLMRIWPEHPDGR